MRRRPLPSVREEAATKSWRSVCENEWVTYTLVASVGALIYSNSLNGEFVHDDIPAIVSNGDVNGANSVLRIFKDDFWGTPMSDPHSHKSYRPLTTITFRVNYALCGVSAWWWHLFNVILHAACCALVARTGVLIARLQRPFAALAALLFAVHPIHTEAVSGVVGRADVLACFFFLSSLLLYHGCTSRHRVVWSVVMAALSMFAKETGLTALLFNIVFDLYRCWGTLFRSPVRWRWKGDNVWSRVSRGLLALIILAGFRLILLQGSLPAFSAQDNPPAFHPSFTVRLLTFCYLAAFNWWLLICPWTLSHDWQMGSVPLVTTLWDYRNLLTGAAILALLALTYRFVMDLELQRHTPAVAGLLLLIIPYLPASNLLVTVGFVVAERVLYIPSVGSVLLTVCGMQALWRRGGGSGKRLMALGVAVVVAGGAARTVLRNQDWRTRETILRADLAVLPHNAKLHYNFANFLKDIEQQENAIKHYKEALRLWPSYASAHNNLGTLEVWSGRAEQHFLLALRYNARHLNAHYNLARLYRKKNRIAESLKMLERCISLEPRFVPAHVEMFLTAAGQDKHAALRRLLDLEPRNWEHYFRYGNWLKGKGLWALSLKYYQSAVRVSYVTSRRAALPPLTAAALLLRRDGQRMRLLHLLTRWQGGRGAGGAAERAWRLRTELAGRAARYTRVTQSKSTCLHHSHLEVSAHSYRTNEYTDIHVKSECQTLPATTNPQFKPTHNKSETKLKSCPLKDRNGPDPFALVSDHLKTY
ncbi:protein O-mannosyl-transferase TMTC1-like [Pieris rapae]|uniref:protein O-mannosyl-transferase TMTC1-like n=1 Tax=Pieris rapae TaxID=64459 RepID=UPI001E27AA9D|nr:protein O-mannosyl-transferase TMTC1-like [Pieris rapae]